VSERLLSSVLTLTFCIGGLWMIAAWRAAQCRALGVRYWDPVRLAVVVVGVLGLLGLSAAYLLMGPIDTSAGTLQ